MALMQSDSILWRHVWLQCCLAPFGTVTKNPASVAWAGQLSLAQSTDANPNSILDAESHSLKVLISLDISDY